MSARHRGFSAASARGNGPLVSFPNAAAWIPAALFPRHGTRGASGLRTADSARAAFESSQTIGHRHELQVCANTKKCAAFRCATILKSFRQFLLEPCLRGASLIGMTSPTPRSDRETAPPPLRLVHRTTNGGPGATGTPRGKIRPGDRYMVSRAVAQPMPELPLAIL